MQKVTTWSIGIGIGSGVSVCLVNACIYALHIFFNETFHYVNMWHANNVIYCSQFAYIYLVVIGYNIQKGRQTRVYRLCSMRLCTYQLEQFCCKFQKTRPPPPLSPLTPTPTTSATFKSRRATARTISNLTYFLRFVFFICSSAVRKILLLV